MSQIELLPQPARLSQDHNVSDLPVSITFPLHIIALVGYRRVSLAIYAVPSLICHLLSIVDSTVKTTAEGHTHLIAQGRTALPRRGQDTSVVRHLCFFQLLHRRFEHSTHAAA